MTIHYFPELTYAPNKFYKSSRIRNSFEQKRFPEKSSPNPETSLKSVKQFSPIPNLRP